MKKLVENRTDQVTPVIQTVFKYCPSIVIVVIPNNK
jgi:hypothetical protein